MDDYCQEIADLRSSLLQTTAARHKDQEKFQFQLVAIEKKLADVITSMQVAEDRASQAVASEKTCQDRHSTTKRQLQQARRVNELIRIERDQLAQALADREHERDQALHARDSLLNRLTSLVSGVESTPQSRSPTSTDKRPRGNSSLGQATSKLARRCAPNLPCSRPLGHPERASVGLSEDFSSSSSLESSDEGDQSDRSSDQTDDSLMAALSSARSTARRRLAASSSRSPIEVSTPDSSPAPLRISIVDLFGEPSSDSDGSLSISSEPRNSCNDLLTVNKFSALPPTTVPRDKWIPGYRNRIPRSATETIPWSARRVSLTSVSELDLNHFFHHFSKPAEFIFPASGKSRRPPASAWSAQLITFAQISRLYDRRPWEIYERQINLISFQRDGWYQILLAQYYGFENRHR